MYFNFFYSKNGVNGILILTTNLSLYCRNYETMSSVIQLVMKAEIQTNCARKSTATTSLAKCILFCYIILSDSITITISIS